MRSAPGWILGFHAADELANFAIDGGPPDMAGVRSPPPEPLKAGAMPGDDALGLYQDQCVGPGRPATAENDPKQPVEFTHLGSRLFAFEDRQLLAEGGDFHREMVSR